MCTGYYTFSAQMLLPLCRAPPRPWDLSRIFHSPAIKGEIPGLMWVNQQDPAPALGPEVPELSMTIMKYFQRQS